jgi:phage/plasmid-associated DNA primase
MESDSKLNLLLENCLSQYSYDIAKLVHYMFKNDYVCGKLKSKLWYHFKDNKWRITELGPYNEISNNIVDLFENYKKNGEHNEDSIQKIDNLLIKLKNVSFKETVCRECIYLFYDADFIKKLDRKMNLICFSNGVWDIQNKILREGYKEDYISLSIDAEYNGQNDKIDYIINQFLQFRKKIVAKRMPNHEFKI